MQSRSKQKVVSSRVIGIDPGFERCGVAVLEENKLLFSTCIITESSDKHEERLLTLGQELGKIIKKWKPNALATEKLFFNINIKTALKVAEARGVILYEAARADLPVHEYSPQAIKIAVTGYGKASKPQVETMVLRLLGLKTPPRHDDETDAIAVAITHMATARN
ncbi:MAG: crossover junction endodeoxyribonuclease RuvC [Patescibacteria group bacterium]